MIKWLHNMSLDVILHLLQTYGYFLLFPLAVIEGPIVTVIAGLLVSLKVFNPLIVFLVVVIADACGDFGLYLLGRLGGTKAARAFCRLFGVTQERLDKAKNLFTEHRTKAVALSKFVHGIGFVGFLAAGLTRVPYRSIVLLALAFSALQCAVFLALGYLFGSAYMLFGHYLNYWAGACAVAVLAGIALYIWRKKYRS